MVAFDHIPGLEVTINVDGDPLREYQDPSNDDDGNRDKVTRYVEAQPGKEFSIVLQIAPRFQQLQQDAMTSDVKIDGRVIVRPVFNMTEDYIYGQTRQVDGVERKVKNEWEKRKLIFSNFDIDSDTARPNGTTDKFKELGEISVTFWLGSITGKIESQTTGCTFLTAAKVHEKALKGRAVSFNTSLGRTTPSKTPNFFSFQKYDRPPFATVIFRYRSFADLRSEMIIPRSPSPIPLEDRPIEQLSVEELRELLRRSQANGGAVKREIKRERPTDDNGGDDDEDDDVDDFVIIEPPPKKPRFTETVDLTID